MITKCCRHNSFQTTRRWGKEDANTPLTTKIEDGCFLLSYKVILIKLFLFSNIIVDSLLSDILLLYWMFGVFLHRTIIQKYDNTIEYLHTTEYTNICLCVMYISILSTMKRAKNDPFYCRLR